MNVRKKQFETSWSLLLIWTLSVLIAVASLRFLVAELAVVMPHMLHHAMARPVSLYLHIGLAPIVLLLLPIQFSKKIRNQHPKLHRWCGRIYAVFILFAGVSGLVLGLTTEAGPIAATGFVFLALFWVVITARAVQLAMQRRVAEHRRWMIRSAALTLAAVTLRFYVPLGAIFVGFETSYVIVSWACWVPNLIFAEWLLRRKLKPQFA